MSPASRARFAEVVRAEPVDLGLACLLVGAEVDPDLDVDTGLGLLDGLASRVRVPAGRTPVAWAAALRAVLGDLSGTAQDYEDLRSSLLHEVLRRRRGLPLLLSIVWLEVAARLELPAYAVALPGHVVVGVGDPLDEHVHVDPFRGGVPVPVPADAEAAAPLALLARLLANVQALATRSAPTMEAARTRLWAVELALLLPSHPALLRRDRGRLLVRLGDHRGGAAELEAYAALVLETEPAEAERCLRDARSARARLN